MCTGQQTVKTKTDRLISVIERLIGALENKDSHLVEKRTDALNNELVLGLEKPIDIPFRRA